MALTALCAVTAAASIATMVRNGDWKNNATLAAATVRAYPECGRAQYFLGQELLNRDDLAGAEMHLQAAVRILPDFPSAHRALGALAFRRGDWPEAQRHMLIAMRYSNCEPDTAITFAALLVQSRHDNQALAMLNLLAVELPRHSRVFSNRAALFYIDKRPDRKSVV